MSKEEQEQQIFLAQHFFRPNIFFLPKINFNENDLWRDETEALNLRFCKLPSAKVLLEFDTEDQVLF